MCITNNHSTRQKFFFDTALKVPSHTPMAYTLENTVTHQSVTCPDERWLLLIEAARANGWEEEGTQYDFAYEIEEVHDAMADYLYNIWMIFHVSREMFEWNGNYTDKKGQVVSESDAYCLMQALEGTPYADDRGLLDFLNSGPFRIRDG